MRPAVSEADAARCRTLLAAAHAVAAVGLTGVCLLLFEWADALSLSAALMVVYAPPAIAVGRRATRHYGLRAALLLVALWLATLAVFYAREVAVLPPVTDFAHPNLESDAGGYWNQALHFYNGSHPPVPMTFYGTSLLMAGLWRLFGVSVAWPLALNVGCTLTAMLLYAWSAERLVRRVLPTARAATLVTAALLLLATWGYFCAVGASLLKDAQVAVTMSMAWTALVAAGEPDHRPRHTVCLLAVACLLLALFRAKYLYFVMAGVVMLGLSGVPEGTTRHNRLRHCAALAAIVVVAWVAGNVTAGARYTVAVQMQTIAGHDMLKQSFSLRPELADIVGDYYTLGQMRRLVLTPFSMVVQTIIPLPWSSGHAWEALSLSEKVSRTTWGWYAAAALAFCYYARNAVGATTAVLRKRRDSQPSLGLLAWWPVAVAAIIAHLTVGSVSRYMLPVRPALLPAILLVICQLRRTNERRAYLLPAAVAIAVTVAALLVCHHVAT